MKIKFFVLCISTLVILSTNDAYSGGKKYGSSKSHKASGLFTLGNCGAYMQAVQVALTKRAIPLMQEHKTDTEDISKDLQAKL